MLTALIYLTYFSFSFILRSNPFYEPKTSSPPRSSIVGPSMDVGSSQKRRAPSPPSSSPGLSPSLPSCKPRSLPEREHASPVGPSPVATVIRRELASSSPKVSRLYWSDLRKHIPMRGTQTCAITVKYSLTVSAVCWYLMHRKTFTRWNLV